MKPEFHQLKDIAETGLDETWRAGRTPAIRIITHRKGTSQIVIQRVPSINHSHVAIVHWVLICLGTASSIASSNAIIRTFSYSPSMNSKVPQVDLMLMSLLETRWGTTSSKYLIRTSFGVRIL